MDDGQHDGEVVDLTGGPLAGPAGAARRLGLLLRAGAVPPSVDESDTCRALCRIAVPGLADQASIYMLAGEELVRTGSASVNDELAEMTDRLLGGVRVPLADHHPLADAVRRARPVMVDRVPPGDLRRLFSEQHWADDVLQLGVHSFFVQPLVVGTRVLGALNLGLRDRGRHFGEEKIALARDLAQAAAVVLENGALARERESSLTLLHSVLQNAPVGFAFFDHHLRYVRVNDALAALNGIGVEEHIGRTLGEVLGDHLPDNVSRDILSVFDTGEPRLDREVHGTTPAAPDVVRDWVTSYYPVRAGGGGDVLYVGATTVEITERKRAESERADLLRSAEAAQAGAEQAQGLAELAQGLAERAQGRLVLLAEASRLFTGALDVAAILTNLVNLVVPLLGDWAVVELLDDGGAVERVAVTHADPVHIDLVAALTPTPGPVIAVQVPFHPVQQVLRTGEAVVIPVVGVEVIEALAGPAPEARELHRRLGSDSMVVVPLRARGVVIGALQVATARSGLRLDEPDMALAAELASRAALAVDAARLYQREHRVAVTLQHSLLPTALPDIAGLERATRYLAGTVDQDVGGDWYDMVRGPDGRVALTIGDVVGHDVHAASVMGQLRNAVRVYASEGHEPGSVVQRLNRLVEHLGLDHMATMVHLALDPVTGALVFTNAGHLPPLVIHADGDTEWLDGGRSLPVGAIAEPPWAEDAITLTPGDTVLLYTDGLVELRTESIDVGLGRLRRAAAAVALEDPDAICDALLHALVSGEARGDDIALMAVRWSPTPVL